MKTNNPRAPEVANEIGARCAWISGEKMYSLDCSQADFDEILAELEAEGPSQFSAEKARAYKNIQSEGYGRDFI